MIDRPELISRVRRALSRSRVVALVGPRQGGKTTLARQLLAASAESYFDLEDPTAVTRLAEPMTALGRLRGLVVIDEVQRRPDLFPVLRVLADRKPLPARFLILGSASPALLRQASESLAGRIEMIELAGFSRTEVGEKRGDRHWLRGGFPPSFLARSDTGSFDWRRQLLRTFVERDLPDLGVRLPAESLLRFWTMVAHSHGGIWSAADPARSLGVSEPTVRRYLDLLSGLFLVRQLPPWHENLAKRQVKAPKVYVRDSGLLHALLGVRTRVELESHPKSGASWEGYWIEEIVRLLEPDAAYFWATHGGAELDLLLFVGGRRFGVEIKRSDAPSLTTSMRIALEDLGLDALSVVYPGERSYELADRVRVVPAGELGERGVRALVEDRRRKPPSGGGRRVVERVKRATT